MTLSLDSRPNGQQHGGSSAQALLAAQIENDELSQRLRRAEAQLSQMDEKLAGAERDVHFLRMRVGVLQAFIDDLHVEIAERTGDRAALAKQYDAMLVDRDRIIRELIQARDTLVECQLASARRQNETLTAWAIAQRARLLLAIEVERAERSAIAASMSWRITKPLRVVAAGVRKIGSLPSRLLAR